MSDRLLADPSPKTIRAVQANLGRDPDGFHQALAWSAISAFAGEGDVVPDPKVCDAVEAAEMLAEEAGTQLGQDLGPFIVRIVAESNLPLAETTLNRFEDLVERAAKCGVEAQLSTFEAAVTGPDISRTVEDDAGDHAPSTEERQLASDNDGGDAASLASVESLIERGPGIAVSLRTLAETVESGRIPTQHETEVLPIAETWVADARTHVSAGRTLQDVADGIRIVIANRAQRLKESEARETRRRELQELLEEVEGLLARDRERLATALLIAHEFESVGDLRENLARMHSEVGDDVGSVGVIPAMLPGQAAELTEDAPGDLHAATAVLHETPAVDAPDTHVQRAAPKMGAPSTISGNVPELLAKSPDDDYPDALPDDGVHIRPDAADDSPSADVPDLPADATEVAERGEMHPTEAEPKTPSSGALSVGQLGVIEPEASEDIVSPPDPFSVSPLDAEIESTVAGLIADERDMLAVIAAMTLGATEDRVRMLQFQAGAFLSRADTLIAQEPDIILAEPTDAAAHNADENRLLFAAHARLALELGFPPVGSLDRFRQFAALDDHPAGDLTSEVAHLVARGFKRPLGALELTALPDDWQRLAEVADAKLSALQSISISYQRASRIVHYLSRTNQVVGSALQSVGDLARRHAAGGHSEDGEWLAIQSLITTLTDEGQCERLLNDADKALSTSQQLRKPIIASARERLRSAMSEVAAVLAEGLALRARAEGSGATGDPQGMANLVAVAQRTGAIAPVSIGDAALGRLVRWLLAEDPPTPSPASLTQLIDDELLPLYEIPRDALGAVTRAEITPAELQLLVEGRDPMSVFEGYLAVGNLQAAGRVAERMDVGRRAVCEEKLVRAGQQLARAARDRIAEVDRVLDRLRSLYDDDLVRQLSQELEALRLPDPARYDLQLEPLANVRDRGELRLEEVRSGLRNRAGQLPNHDESVRILALLESRDEQLAFDYLNLAEAGEPLPVLTPPSGDDFGEFFPSVVRAAESANLQRAMDNIGEVRKRIGAKANPTDRMLSRGLKSWIDLVIARRADNMTEGRLADVLRMLGLIPRDQNWRKELTRAKHAGYATYAVKAAPLDRSYVPSLGTQAHGSYDVTIVWDAASPQRLLQYVETGRRTEPNIILYLQTMTVEQRLELRKLTARQGFDFSPIVVDMPVVAWLSTREEPGWRMTQRITLPFTTLNPYTPFAGGEVPDEVFVGRESEQREIIDPTGSMFVYGGRQLGKSALLRRVERGIMRVHDSSSDTFEHSHLAVYIDLKSEGIGESAAPSALWGALGPRLSKLGVVKQPSRDWTADSVVSGIESWLDADRSRRLLLLLDESDNFLTIDAQDTGPLGVGGFPVLQRLKGLMERSGRRFKPVFAGLHQVQRFHGLPNTPVVHGGQDILIGPLRAVDARELVRDPLFALGYEFETPDTMWRLLRLTNYQASLIQIICEALVRHMRVSSLSANGGRVVVTARDVDDVYAKRDVRDLIAQRFRWTINLDSRYKVIALVTALLSLESTPGERFPAGELHDECASFWPAGFSRSTLSSGEFFRYLDEMQGLGVLHRQGDEFGLRSPSIIGLLGSKETIEAELLEASDQLDVGYQYNPTMNRRILTQDTAGVETRSPLPDAELAALLDHSQGEPRIKVVAGSRALGIDRVTNALERAAADRPVRIVKVDEFTLLDQVGGGADAHLVLDLSAVDAPTRRNALLALLPFDEAFVTVVLPVEDLPLDPVRFHWPVTMLRRWSLAALQSWNDSPFRRQDLKSGTGGWPELVEKAISMVVHGSSTESAMDAIHSELCDPNTARNFLSRASIPLEVARAWLDAVGFENGDGDVDIEAASMDYVNDVFEPFDMDADSIIERLQRLDVIDEVSEGWLLDPAVALAVRAQDG